MKTSDSVHLGSPTNYESSNILTQTEKKFVAIIIWSSLLIFCIGLFSSVIAFGLTHHKTAAGIFVISLPSIFVFAFYKFINVKVGNITSIIFLNFILMVLSDIFHQPVLSIVFLFCVGFLAWQLLYKDKILIRVVMVSIALFAVVSANLISNFFFYEAYLSELTVLFAGSIIAFVGLFLNYQAYNHICFMMEEENKEIDMELYEAIVQRIEEHGLDQDDSFFPDDLEGYEDVEYNVDTLFEGGEFHLVIDQFGNEKFESITEGAIELFGFEIEENFPNPQDVWKKIIEKDKLVKNSFARMPTKKSVRTEYRVMRFPNEIIWVESVGIIHYDEKTQQLNIHEIINDITDQKVS